MLCKNLMRAATVQSTEGLFTNNTRHRKGTIFHFKLPFSHQHRDNISSCQRLAAAAPGVFPYRCVYIRICVIACVIDVGYNGKVSIYYTNLIADGGDSLPRLLMGQLKRSSYGPVRCHDFVSIVYFC